MRPRHIAAVAVVLGLTVAGFIVARANAERDARRDSEQRAEIAAAQIRTRVAVATSLTESLRRFMLDEGATGVTNDEFTRNALRWLSPADLPAAAWAEQVRAADRFLRYDHRESLSRDRELLANGVPAGATSRSTAGGRELQARGVPGRRAQGRLG